MKKTSASTLLRLARLSAAIHAVALLAMGCGGGNSGSAAAEPAAGAQRNALTVRAKGTLVDGQGPRMQVQVDGQFVGEVEVLANTFTDYRFTLAAPADPAARIDVIFTNEAASSTGDRHLFVESLTVGERVLRPTDPGVILDRGAGAAAVDGVDVSAGQTTLYSDAALRFGATDAVVQAAVPAPATAPQPTPAPAPTPAAAPAPAPANEVNLTTFGAVCNGSFNNSAAIASAIASARSKGATVVVPVGTCAYASVIRLDGVKLRGSGDTSVLYALDPQQESIFMSGDGAAVSYVKLSGVKSAERKSAWEATRITLFSAKNFLIDHVSIDGSAAAGIQTTGATKNGRITFNSIKDTLADSIHLTDKASLITLENNRIENAGDDGIAVVSYQGDGGLVDRITARNNVILNNRWGRNMSVVGGSNILYENNYVEGNLGGYACLYIAQENSYNTYGASNVVVQRNTLKNCGSTATGHGAVMLFSDGAMPNTNVTLIRNDLIQNGQAGIRVFGSNTTVKLDSNRITGASPATNISSSGVSVTPYASGLIGYSAP